MKLAASIALACSLLIAAPARAAAPASTVRSFFAALDRRDFGGALAFTEGTAASVIANMLNTISREAARQHVEVELRVRSLRVTEHERDELGQIPVEVAYDIDVVGKKWLFHRVARRLSGTASFFVDASAPRIVAISGTLYP